MSVENMWSLCLEKMAYFVELCQFNCCLNLIVQMNWRVPEMSLTLGCSRRACSCSQCTGRDITNNTELFCLNPFKFSQNKVVVVQPCFEIGYHLCKTNILITSVAAKRSQSPLINPTAGKCLYEV